MRSMLQLNPLSLLASFLFGTLGTGAFLYGRRLELWQPRAIGIALCTFPYVVSGWLQWTIGCALLGLLWRFHDE